MEICIDSGHCKLTAGKRAFDNSFYEWEFNYDIANRISKLLSFHGVNNYVQYVENSDPKVELNQRISQINKRKPDLVVSIHANAYGSSWNDVKGWEIFCSDPNNQSKSGTKLASAIHSFAVPALGLKDRGIKDAHGVAGIVTKTTSPAVLIEHGFYTNQEELKLLKSEDFRQRLAIADSKGILKYLKIAWRGDNMAEKHWAEKHLDSLYKKGYITNPEQHRKDLDNPIPKCQVFALLDRITGGEKK